MSVTKAFYMIVGVMIAVSAALGFFHSKYWLLFTFFIGLNLFQFAFTGLCPMITILKKLGLKSDSSVNCAPDVGKAVGGKI